MLVRDPSAQLCFRSAVALWYIQRAVWCPAKLPGCYFSQGLGWGGASSGVLLVLSSSSDGTGDKISACSINVMCICVSPSVGPTCPRHAVGPASRQALRPALGGCRGEQGARAAFGISTNFCSTLGVVSYSDFTTVKTHLEFLVPLVLVCNNYLVFTLLKLSCDSRVIQGRPNPPWGL